MRDEHEELRQMIAERKRVMDENNRLYSKKRLADNMQKKIKTTMIGALSCFEDFFGELWGIDKAEEELTKEEMDYRDLWEKVRYEVLNKGNKQSRIAVEEIEEYTIMWNKYKIEFKRGQNG